MTVSRRRLPGLEEFRGLFNKKHVPKSPQFLPRALKVLVKWTGPLTADQNEFAESWIQDFAARFLHDLALRGAVSSSAAYLRKVHALLKRFESFNSLLVNASCEDVGAISLHDSSMFDRLSKEVAMATQNLRRVASIPSSEPDAALECFSDPKFSLILGCRDLMSSLSRKQPGYTKEGPLASFAAAVFVYATGQEPESFERQIKKLKIYDRHGQCPRCSVVEVAARGRQGVKSKHVAP